ncbi:hypothetical protein OPT61_g3878 [Boeremia exigua]|uniref:Uncharacterized protein n=1 Tax=Boeremia exigua TaxID=749465 RepID=A0ACC2IGB8_9PLEO|nr:hypothetical protein OPT61_g3878 [Boeremia exigua]
MKQPSPLANPLATVAQLEVSSTQLDGIPRDLEESIYYAGARLTQAAGILLRLPQEVIAQAIIVFLRFWVGADGGSLDQFGAGQVSASSLYLVTKLSAHPKSARSLINVYAYLDAFPLPPTPTEPEESKAEMYFVSEGTFERRRASLFETEQRILKTLGFQVQANLPYTLCITYMQALDVFTHPRAPELAKRAVAHLNTALLSPQLLYLTHQPTSLATAAIYLAARQAGIKLPDTEWWEAFDTDREELGFLCVGFLSVEGFAEKEREKWAGRRVPLTVEEVDAEIESRLDYGEDYTVTPSHANSMDDRVQPTENPYNWEHLTDDRSNVSTWTKASWSCANEIIRLEAGVGTLKRNTAIRRSGKERTTERTASGTGAAIKSVSKTSTMAVKDRAGRINRSPKAHRRFSFEDRERCDDLGVPLESREEEQAISKIITRIDSGMGHSSKGMYTQIRKDLDRQRPIPRTFSEILGDDFVPTALLEGEEDEARL